MMESSSNWKSKLLQFRIKELKDVLTQLGLAKQGKKQDLMDRISGLLSDEQDGKMLAWGKKYSIGKEGVLKIIDDTYRKMQIPGGADLASKVQSNPAVGNVKPKEVPDSCYNNAKVRCLCGITSNIQSMIQCEDTRCQIWQHLDCVDVDGIRTDVEERFFCEICRINRADPFWITVAHPLPPIKLISSSPAPDGSMQVQSTEKTFQLTRADGELLKRPDHDLQAWCILLNDKVSFRMQWPQFVDLKVNGVPVRTINRPGSQLLGINGRDDGSVITTCSREGQNKICLTRADSRVFCFGIRIARRRTLQQVLSLVPNESDGENLEDALARVCRCIGGVTTEKSADSDSDIEVVAESNVVNLRCPMSGTRIKVAGRFKPCVHMGCFDLETFVELNQRSRKWQCPICLKNYTLENLIVDPYFNRITSLLQNCGEDLNEIEVKPNGSWRAKNEGELKDLGQWHLPDGSLCISTNEGKESELHMLKPIKQEVAFDGQTNLKFKKNLNGIWEICKTDETNPSASGNHTLERFDPRILNIPMSSSATGSYKDGDFSMNPGVHFDFSMNADDRTVCKDSDVIVLSDSDEDLTPDIIYGAHGADHSGDPFPTAAPIPDSYSEDHGVGTSGTAQVDLIGNGDGYNNFPLWSLQNSSQTGSGLQLFKTNVNVQDDMANMELNPFAHAPINGYELTEDGYRGGSFFVEDLPTCPNADVNGSLVDNPLAFDNNDPALRFFLPDTPADVPLQTNMNGHTDISQGSRSDDLLSLRLGAGAALGELATANGLDSRPQYPSKDSREARMDPGSNTASLQLSMHEERSNMVTSNNKRSDGPFSHPRQPRSIRPRYLSIDLDSE